MQPTARWVVLEGLDRFIKAQKCYYDTALKEVREGRKESHWIWYIFPQIKGLGYSTTAREYAIDGREEAIAFMQNPELRGHLIEISQALLDSEVADIADIFGYPDDLKVKSCMTLFMKVCPEEKIFSQVLDKYFEGEVDEKTVELLGYSSM